MAKIDGDALKTFFINHGEKFGVGIVAMTALLLLYTGFSKEKFPDTKTPDSLQKIAGSARSALDQPHWDAIAAERPFKTDFANKAEQAQRPIQPKLYEIIPLKPVKEKNNILRHDPEIYPPEQVRTVSLLGALSVRSESPNPVEALEAAESIKSGEKNRPPTRSKQRRNGTNAMDSSTGSESGMMGSEASMYGSSSMGMDSSSMGSGMALGAARLLMPKYYEGFKAAPSGGSGGMDERMMSPTGSESNSTGSAAAVAGPKEKLTSKTGWFIAGSALIPEKRLIEEFERAFLDAQGYRRERDRPLFVGIHIRRADVTDRAVEALVEKDWLIIHSVETLNHLISKWDGPVADPVPLAFRLPPKQTNTSILQMTIGLPPLLMRDYSSIATHPSLPEKFEGRKAVKKAATTDVDVSPIDLDAAPTVGAAPPGGSPSGYGGEGMSGGSMYGEGNAYGMSSGIAAVPQGMVAVRPEFKLVRFYDFFAPNDQRSIRPKRKYVYQVRFQIEDPNFPGLEALEPIARHLMPDALVRVDKLKAAYRKTRKVADRQWYRTSEWSKPSAPVELPTMQDFFTGPVVAAKSSPIGPKKTEVERNPPSGKAMALRWNYEYALYVPVAVDVGRGSVIDHLGAADVIDPLSKKIKVLPPEKGGAVRTGATVIEFAGAEQLAQEPKNEKMVSPGMMLMFDPNGGLRLLDEIDSAWEYRKHTFADEHEAAVAVPAAGSAGPMGGYDPSMMTGG